MMIVEKDRLEKVIEEIVQEIVPNSPTPPSVESDSDLSMEMEVDKTKIEPIPPPYEEDVYSDDIVVEPPKPDLMEDITPSPPEVESTPEPQTLPVPTFKFQPYALPPPETLSSEHSISFIKNAFKNILDVEAALSADVKDKRSNVVLTTLSNGKRLTKSQLHIMASRFLTRGLETYYENGHKQFDDLREMIVQFILKDFRNRTEFALTWLDEEWYHDSIMLRKDSSYQPNYSIWLCKLLDRIMPALEDHIFTQFLLDVPELFEDAVDRIKIFCNDPDRSSLGFATLSELIELRPPARPFCLNILLAYCLHKGERLRNSAITKANKWFPDHPVVGSEVESFALQSLKQLTLEVPPPTYDFHYHYHYSETTKIIKDEMKEEERKWTQVDVERHLDLFLSLVAKKRQLFEDLVAVYITSSDSIQKMIRNYSQKMIDTIGLAGLLDLFQTFPSGAEDFVLRLLIVYTNRMVHPPTQLINTAKTVIVQRNLDGRFLFPIIAYFDKEEILRHLPKVIVTLDATEKQREIVKKVFMKILTVSAKTPTPLKPMDLLVFLHQLKPNEVPLKHSVEAIHVCFKLNNIYNSQILGAVLQHLSVQSELPPSFMRTVTLSVRTYKNLSSVVNELLLRHINHIWQNEMLRKGFILYCTEYCLKIQPNDFKFLLRLPKTQILEVLEQKDPTLKKQFRKTMLESNADQRRLLQGYLIELLEISTKKTTGQKVAIFVDNPLRKSYDKKETEKVYAVLKREASQLSRLRHPSLLEVVEAVEESRTVITFATEPILSSLANLLGNYDNLSPIPDDIKNFDMDELEIQKGLLQVGKGLQFCHNDAKIVHSNLVPEAIFVNTKGDWKIGGFGFSTFITNPDASAPYEYPDYDVRIPSYAQKNLDYMAPEYVLDENLDFANDMFALGCLIYTVHNHGKPPIKNHNSIQTYRKNIENLSSISYEQLPYHLHEVMFNLITRYPSQRMTAIEFQTSKYFDNVLVSTVKFFESFPEKTADDKANFMKGLIRILPQFPERVLVRKILPSLLQELKDYSLLAYTLPNIFFIAQKLPPNDFCDKVLIPLKPIFSISEPMQNMITCLDNIDLFQQKTSSSIFKDDVMPLIYNALETRVPAIQDKVLKVIPTIADSLDISTVKASLFPRIQNLFIHTTILSIKVTTLICLHSLIKLLDNFTITEKLIPLLKGIKTKEPSVMIATLTVYEEMGKSSEKDVIATEIIPQLWKLSVVPTLNLQQTLSMKVEKDHSRQLQDIKNIEDNTRKFEEGGKDNDMNNIPVDFEKLVGSSGRMINNNAINSVGNCSTEIPPDPFDTPDNGPIPGFITTYGPSNMSSKTNNELMTSTIQADFFTSNGVIPISQTSRNSLSSTNTFMGNQNQTQAQSINSYSTISTSPSLNKIPSLPPPNFSSKAGTLSSISTSSSISSSLFNSIATSTPMSPISHGKSNTMNTTRPSSFSMNNATPSLNNFNSQINSVSLNSSSLNNDQLNMKNMNATPSYNPGSILQPISSSNKSGFNSSSGTNQKISKGDLTMFDPYS
ncbi:11321_t:CDS:10 [Funneliformis geosporum]|uniref:11321_t:CDS:1 n=1 Tax=Funneliformis geosporum TaxID=1117311 RepID=A0A9W4SC59_9GLOM|nr:11321_t:CDS:10 [Funneliformis geosporum]